MRRALMTVLALCLFAGACSNGGSDGGSKAANKQSSTTSTPTPAAPATTPALDGARVALTKLATLERPTALAVRAGDPTLYVAEKTGRVRAYRDGALAPKPALDITAEVGGNGDEQGLLGLVFSPDGDRLFLDFTNHDGDTRVVEYTVRNRMIDVGSARELLAIDQPQSNHNGGQLAFGPDALLYVGMGDGGAAGDQGPGHAPGGNAQSTDTLLGKILRIDPKASAGRPYSIPPGNPYAKGGGRPEIWALGLRNPWRFSFDRTTGDLWIGDVGQNAWEEIDFLPRGNGAGDNFGWNPVEGTHRFAGDAPAGAVAPIFEYGHGGTGACSVTGGYVSRGTGIPALRGAYVFADYCAGELHALTQSDGTLMAERSLGAKLPQVSSFGEDGAGELYVLSDSDGLYRIDPA